MKIHLKLCFDVKILLKLCFDKAELLTGDAVRTGRGCRFWRSSRRIDNLKLHLFTFSFTYSHHSIKRPGSIKPPGLEFFKKSLLTIPYDRKNEHCKCKYVGSYKR